MARTPNRFIKNMDIFGEPISLNFDRKGSTHQTCFGGICTVLFLVFATVVVIIQFKFLLSADNIFYYTYEIPVLDEDRDACPDCFKEAKGHGTIGVYMYLKNVTNSTADTVTTIPFNETF